ncbi:MAG: hypothetical protein ACRC8P_00875 [Spiroplasma sp.]
MKGIFFHFSKDRIDRTNKKEPFIPYQNKVRIAYFSYSGLFWFLGLLVYIFSFFIIINLAKNEKFQLTSKDDINFFFTPILNLILVTISWFLLLFAPRKAYKSPKHSSIMFYFSFWFLVISVVLNAQLQLTYIEVYSDEAKREINSITIAVAQIVIILSVISLLGVQVFFWVMRRNFAFMATDYEIYMERANNKKEKKLFEEQIKKQNAKLTNKKS